MSGMEHKKLRTAMTTAGLRGTKWDAARLPSDASMSAHALVTADNVDVTGYLFSRGREDTVICAMHPREMNVTQYLVPDLLNAGVAVWIQGGRAPGNDIRLEHEKALLDLAAGQLFLRGEAGFKRTILQGTSGGGPLAAFYCQQSALPGDARLKRSPGGRATGLEKAALPPPDGVVLISSHLGQGQLLLKTIDPSILDELDPRKIEESLSAFNPENGYEPAPNSSHYSPEFLRRYRSAQEQRIRLIDAFCIEQLERKAIARKAFKASGRREDAVSAAYGAIFQVWCTDADPRCFDLSLEPSDRAYGTLWGANQAVSNYGSVGFARVCTPESWLSNWSAFHSNASMEKCAPAISQPSLMIEYTGDNSVFASEADFLFNAIGTCSKKRIKIHGNHHGRPIDPARPNGQIIAGEEITTWLRENQFI